MSNVNELLEKYEYKGRGKFEPEIEIDKFLLEVIKGKGDITRREIAEITNIPRTTIYDTVKKLIYEGEIEKYSVSNKRRGRPKVYYRVKED
ncbi:MAG: winged helix-turn-helix transcriptional regulator [Candidatus Lokiarchaeota archaeon]|nr:winged helix-turn-helix transcriptional regulator [Candidatus Lokiarchaeota archaeon]